MIFNIKKGENTCFKFPMITFRSSIIAKITLIGDFTYTSDNKNNQRNANKIFGLSDGWYHRKNSIRIGYRYLEDKIELVSYRYNDGENYTSIMGYINIGEEFDIKITISDKYYITFKNVTFEYKRTSKWWFPLRYILLPHFGIENELTKNDLKFKIKII